MEALQALDWVGLLSEGDNKEQGARFVLLADPASTPLQPLMQRLLLEQLQQQQLILRTFLQ